MRHRLALLVLATALCSTAFGQTTWVGGTSSSWNDGTNWTGGVVPGAGDDVTIDGAVVCQMDVAADVASLTVAATYTGTLDAATDNLDHAISGSVTGWTRPPERLSTAYWISLTQAAPL